MCSYLSMTAAQSRGLEEEASLIHLVATTAEDLKRTLMTTLLMPARQMEDLTAQRESKLRHSIHYPHSFTSPLFLLDLLRAWIR